MIEKWYEVTCDYCGTGINHYIGNKPTKEEMKDDRIVCTSTKQFCSNECYANWKQLRRHRKQNDKVTYEE